MRENKAENAPRYVERGPQASSNARRVAQLFEAWMTLVRSQMIFWKLPELCIGSLECLLSGMNSQVLHARRITFTPSALSPTLLTWLIHINFNCFCNMRGQLPDCVRLLCTDQCTQIPCLHGQAWTSLCFVTPVRRVIDKAMHSLQGGKASQM